MHSCIASSQIVSFAYSFNEQHNKPFFYFPEE
jgi:hypothetical protein